MHKAHRDASATSFAVCPNPEGNGGESNPAALKKLLEVGPGHTQRQDAPLPRISYDKERVKEYTNAFVAAYTESFGQG